MNNNDYSVWLCSCGQENIGNFCKKCGKKKQFKVDEMSIATNEIERTSYDDAGNNNGSKIGSRFLDILIGIFIVVAVCCSGYIAHENGMIDYFFKDNTKVNHDINDKKIESNIQNTITNNDIVDDKEANALEPSKVWEHTDARNPDGANVYAGSNAQKSLVQYYQNITDKNMSSAYALLSQEMQNNLGTYENFSGGYNDTISSAVKNITTLSSSDGHEEIEYYLEARDRINNSSKVKVTNFKGVAKMKMINDVWIIDELNVKKIGEYLE